MPVDSTMKIKAIAPYFGGKRNLAPWIVGMMGEHAAYWEPFCGSLAVLLAKPRCSMETANDLYGDIINLARVVADPMRYRDLLRRLRRTLYHEDLYSEAAAALAADCDGDAGVDRAYLFFVFSWMGRNGAIGAKNVGTTFSPRYTRNGGHAGTRWRSTVDSIPAWHARMRGVSFLHRDAMEVLDRIEDEARTVVYLDPPYLNRGKYKHHAINHAALAAAASRFKSAHVLISYYDDPEIIDLYPGWSVASREVSKATAHQGRRGENDSRETEIVLSNRQLDDMSLWI